MNCVVVHLQRMLPLALLAALGLTFLVLTGCRARTVPSPPWLVDSAGLYRIGGDPSPSLCQPPAPPAP